MTDKEYLDKTRDVTNFLMHVFDKDMILVARAAAAQADHDTAMLIDMLYLVKSRCEVWLEDLKVLENEK